MKRLALLLLLAPTVHAQLTPKAADAIVPVVGSTRGQSNANFKTELQLANPDTRRMTGWLIFHPQGRPGTAEDPVLRYDLAPHTTLSFADVLASLGATGLGSLDVFVENGELPTVVARAFDDQGDGTTGVTVPLVPLAAILTRNDIAALIAPRDLTRFRFNIGVRTLESGATLDLTVRSADGTERHRRTVSYRQTFFEQAPGDAFAGVALQTNDSIEIRIAAGSAIVYGSMVDNRTNDSALQVLRK